MTTPNSMDGSEPSNGQGATSPSDARGSPQAFGGASRSPKKRRKVNHGMCHRMSSARFMLPPPPMGHALPAFKFADANTRDKHVFIVVAR